DDQRRAERQSRYHGRPQFNLIPGSDDAQIGNMPEEGEVERPVMRRTVFADKPRPIQTERHREILDADVMDDLIVGTLCKGGVDGHEGTESLRGESGRESHGMLFADAYVREAGR